MGLVDVPADLVSHAAQDTQNGKSSIEIMGASFRELATKADLSDDKEGSFTARQRAIVCERLAGVVNSFGTRLNEGQAAEVLRAVAELARYSNGQGIIEGKTEREFGRELRELAVFVNSCSG